MTLQPIGSRRIIAAMLVIVLLGAAARVYQLWRAEDDERERALRQSEQHALVLAGAIDTRVTAMVETIDFALLTLRGEYGRDAERFRVVAQTLLGTFPADFIAQISVADASGTLVYSTLDLPSGLSIRDREHFRAHLAGGPDALFISKPVLGRVSGTKTIQFSRAISRHGRLEAVAVISVSPDYISRQLAIAPVVAADTVALFDAQGTLLARNRGPEDVGRQLGQVRPFMRADGEARGTYRAEALLDGQRRLFAWERVGKLPLFAVVGIHEDSMFEPIRLRFVDAWAATGLGLAVFVAALGVALALLAREQRRVEGSEARFRHLTAMSSDWYWEQDAQFRFTYMSGELRAHTGIAIENHIGKARWEMPASGISPAEWDAHRALLARHEPFRDFVMRRPDADGREHWVSISGEPVFGADGAFAGYRGVGHDITERTLLERSLREVQARLRLIFDLVPDGLYYLDSGQVLRAVNQPYCTMIGLGEGELLGRTLREVLGEATYELNRVFTERALGGERVRYERKASPRPSGPRDLEIELLPDRDERGAVRGVVAVVRDVTAQNEAQRRIEEAGARLSAVVDSAMDAIVIADRERRILHFNPAAERIFGYVRAEVMNHPLEILMPEALREAHPRYVAEFGDSGATSRAMGKLGTVTGLHRSGRQFPLEASIASFESGGRRFYSAILRDVSVRLRIEAELRDLTANLERRVSERTAELEAAVQELEAFSYSVSHDLRAPLRAIAGFASMLAEDEGPRLTEEGRRMLGVVDRNATRMGELVDDLLTLARLSRHPPAMRPVDLRAVAESVAAALRADYPVAQFDIGEVPPCEGDPLLVQQLLANLLENAFKYSSRAAQPRIAFGWDATLAAYYVRDNGVGFDMAYADKLFGTFQRLHADGEFPGTGIGLAIVKRVAERHGGRAWAQARPGEGATFWFSLPGGSSNSA